MSAPNADRPRRFSYDAYTLNFRDEMVPVICKVVNQLCKHNCKRDAEIDPRFKLCASLFRSTSIPAVAIEEYIERFYDFADCSNTCFILAMIYLDEFQHRTGILVDDYNIHRLFLTSLMIATKFFDDSYESNEVWAFMGGISNEELNELEMEFLASIEFELMVTNEVYRSYEAELYKSVPMRKKKSPSSVVKRHISPKKSLGAASDCVAHVATLAKAS